MNRTALHRWLLLPALVLGLGAIEATAQVRPKPAAAPAAANAPAVRIREVGDVGGRSMIRSPEYNTDYSRGHVAPRNWGQLRALFDTTPDWIDELTVSYYALLYDRAKDQHTLFKGSVTHINVAKGTQHLSTAYLNPNTIERFGPVVAVACEISYGGAVVDKQSTGRQGKGQALPEEWWTKFNQTVKEGLILNRGQTPFAFINPDDYESVK